MSLAMEIGAGIGGPGFVRGIACVAIFDSAEIEGRKRMDPSPSPTEAAAAAVLSASSSSSIGKDSDEAGSREGEDGGGGEVQSAYKGPPVGMESLEESLPIRYFSWDSYFDLKVLLFALSDSVVVRSVKSECEKKEWGVLCLFSDVSFDFVSLLSMTINFNS